MDASYFITNWYDVFQSECVSCRSVAPCSVMRTPSRSPHQDRRGGHGRQASVPAPGCQGREHPRAPRPGFSSPLPGGDAAVDIRGTLIIGNSTWLGPAGETAFPWNPTTLMCTSLTYLHTDVIFFPLRTTLFFSGVSHLQDTSKSILGYSLESLGELIKTNQHFKAPR